MQTDRPSSCRGDEQQEVMGASDAMNHAEKQVAEKPNV